MDEPVKPKGTVVMLDIPKDAESFKAGVMFRDLHASEVEITRDAKLPNVIRMRFPVTDERAVVPQPYGMERLSHDPGAVQMQRVALKAVPMLFNHNWNDIVGMVDGGEIINGRMWVDTHFFETPRSKEVVQMVEGGLRNVSAGYRLLKVKEDPGIGRQYTAEQWEPIEISIVSVPADPTVGLGRAMDLGDNDVVVVRSAPIVPAIVEDHRMDTPANPAQQPAAQPVAPSVPAQPIDTRSMNQPIQPQISGVAIDQQRRQQIGNMVKLSGLPENMVEQYHRSPMTLAEISDDMVLVIEQRGRTNPTPASKIGMEQSQIEAYSLRKAILACMDKDWSQAPLEAEASKEISKRMQKPYSPTKFYVPFEALQRSLHLPGERLSLHQQRMFQYGQRFGMDQLTRDLTVASAGAGGYLVQTDNIGFIEMLRNRTVCTRLGARVLGGLQGNVTIPRQSAAATAVWLSSESATITESQQTFVQVALTPKTVGAYTELSRLLLLQSNPQAEGIVTDDLAQVVAIAVDLAGLSGSGSGGQPTGITNTSGIGTPTATSIDYAKTLTFQTTVAGSNVTPQRGGYVTTPTVVGTMLMTRVKFTNTASPLWNGNVWDGEMCGFPGMSSNQMGSGTMIFGDWSELVLGEWGVLEVEVNPFANFQAGIIGVRAMYTMDVGVRRPFAFAYASSVT